jgi:hypothetical protein
MARFQLTQAMTIPGQSFPLRLKAGSFLCNGTACAAGDAIWTGLNAQTYQPYMTPLDGAATTIKNASPFASVAPATFICGADSIDA